MGSPSIRGAAWTGCPGSASVMLDAPVSRVGCTGGPRSSFSSPEHLVDAGQPSELGEGPPGRGRELDVTPVEQVGRAYPGVIDRLALVVRSLAVAGLGAGDQEPGVVALGLETPA